MFILTSLQTEIKQNLFLACTYNLLHILLLLLLLSNPYFCFFTLFMYIVILYIFIL